MKTRISLYLLFLTVTIIVGCKAPQKIVEEPELDYNRPLPAGQHALRKITNLADIPDFTSACTNLYQLIPAVERSLSYLAKASSKQFFPVSGITHEKTVESLTAFLELLNSGMTPNQMNAMLRSKFDAYISIGCDDMGTVLFTGYYTPVFNGSLERTGRFKYPLYAQPDDLVKGNNGEILGRRSAAGQVTRYPSRAEIEQSNMLQGKELVWLSDEFEVYIAHVQGSAKIKLPNGQSTTLGYAANNGHEYESVAKALVAQGKISQAQMNLTTMIEYFKTHPEEVSGYTKLNPRFVFFKKDDGEPRGSLNELVTPMRTIATDKSIFPRASLVFISTKLPQAQGYTIAISPYNNFVLDQDTGGAIRAPGRCDVYMGIGNLAGTLAGRTYQEGEMYYLFLK